MNPRYIVWPDIFARDAPFNLVIASRELGKSFGMREQILRDYKGNGERAVAVVRYKDDIGVAIADYFSDVLRKTGDKVLARWGAEMEFQTVADSIQCRKKSDEKKNPNRWDEIVRFIPLSKATRYKQATMSKLRRVVFDEAIIDRTIDTYTRYLPNEYRLLQNLIGTLQRYSDKDNGRPRLRAYLMGNAVDLVNPYFAALGIDEQPRFGGRWLRQKSWFLFYADPASYERKERSEQMAELMGDSAGDYGNQFAASASDFVAKKPSTATFDFGIAYRGDVFGVWLDIKDGIYYVNTRVPQNTTMPIYALSTQDNKPNYIVAKTANKTLRGLSELYCYGCVRFDKPATRERFNNVLALFGVH